MFKNSSTYIFLFSIGPCLLLIGCQPTAGRDIEAVPVTRAVVSEDETNSLVAVTVAPTHPLAQTAIATWTATSSPTVSPTSLPTLTPAPTETATPPPWPTLSPDEAPDKVLSLLADNQNPDCLLPCWWGATPGQTEWKDIEPFLNSFALKIRIAPEGASVELPLPESVILPGFDYNVVYIWNESQVIQEIDIDSINILGYDAKTMVTLYGVPDEVWLNTLDEPREEVLPFQLIIVYQQQGISLRYYVDASTNGEIVTACFEPGFVELKNPDLFPASPRIYVWEPGQHKTIDEIANIPWEIYFPLAEKTDLTPQTLYEKFTNPDEQPCIDTLADLWRDY